MIVNSEHASPISETDRSFVSGFDRMRKTSETAAEHRAVADVSEHDSERT